MPWPVVLQKHFSSSRSNSGQAETSPRTKGIRTIAAARTAMLMPCMAILPVSAAASDNPSITIEEKTKKKPAIHANHGALAAVISFFIAQNLRASPVKNIQIDGHHRPFSLGVATITPTRRGRCRPMSTLRASSGCSAALMTVLMMPT